jgi:hypothetical protein
MGVPTTDAIREQLEGCCREMVEIRRTEGEGRWQDSNGQGLVLTCEALMCFVAPSLAMGADGSPFIGDILREDELVTSLRVMLDQSASGFLGAPYINFEHYASDGKDHGFVDGACFVSSVILGVSKLCWDSLPDDLRKDLREKFSASLKFLVDAFIDGKGWSWGDYGKPDNPFLYSTWTVVEAIDDLLQAREHISKLFPETDDVIARLEDMAAGTCDYLLQHHMTQSGGGANRYVNLDATSGVIAFDQDDSSVYYNLWAVLPLLLLGAGSDTALQSALDVVMEELSEKLEKYKAATFQFMLDGTELSDFPQFLDRAFLPLVLKTYSIFCLSLSESALLGRIPWLERLYEMLLDNRDAKKRRFVWDKFAHRDTGYAVYYTERAVEALCRLYRLASRIEQGGLAESLDEFTGALSASQWDTAWADMGRSLRQIGGFQGSLEKLAARVDLLEQRLSVVADLDFEELGRERKTLFDDHLASISQHRQGGDLHAALRATRAAREEFPQNEPLKRIEGELEKSLEQLGEGTD